MSCQRIDLNSFSRQKEVRSWAQFSRDQFNAAFETLISARSLPRNGIKHISSQDLLFQMWWRSRFFQSVAIHRNSARTILGWFQWEGSCSIMACSKEGLQRVHAARRERGSSCKCMPSKLAAGVASNFSCRSCMTI